MQSSNSLSALENSRTNKLLKGFITPIEFSQSSLNEYRRFTGGCKGISLNNGRGARNKADIGKLNQYVMKANTEKPKGKLRMPKDKFVKDEYANGSALYAYTFRSKSNNHDESKLQDVDKILCNIKNYKSPNSFEIIKQSIGKQIDYVHCQNSELQDEIKQTNEDMLVAKYHTKAPDMTPYLRIKQIENQEPQSYIKKISEMNNVIDKFDSMFSDIQQQKNVYRTTAQSVGRTNFSSRRLRDSSVFKDAITNN